jgi:hypothetical protein
MIATFVEDWCEEEIASFQEEFPTDGAKRRDAKLEREIGRGTAARSDASSGDLMLSSR